MASTLKHHRLPPVIYQTPVDYDESPMGEVARPNEHMIYYQTIRHRDSMGESTATSTSTGNNNKFIPSYTATGTTGTTEIASNLQMKRKVDDCGEDNQAMLLDDIRVEDPDPHNRSFSCPTSVLSTLPRNKKRRSGPSSLHSSFNRRSFVMDVETPFFALLEALEPASCRDDHRRTILYPHIRTTHDHTIPQPARILELPAISLFGVWVAELRQWEASASMATEDLTCLGSSILSLRHHSRATISSLKNYYQDSTESDTLAVSAIHPEWTRQTQIDSQRICSAVELHHKKGDNKFFISSISLAGFEGFTCSTDLNMNASKVSASILEGLEVDRPSRQKNTICPALLGIAGVTRPVGVSVLCDLEMACDYTIWIGQDLTLQSSPIVAIDVIFSDQRCSLTGHSNRHGVAVSNSPNSSNSARESNEDDAIQELSELNLRAHTQSIGLTGYDPFERLWNNNRNHHHHHHHNYNSANLTLDIHSVHKTRPQQTPITDVAIAKTMEIHNITPETQVTSPNSLGPLHLSPEKPSATQSRMKKLQGEQYLEVLPVGDENVVDGSSGLLSRQNNEELSKGVDIQLVAMLTSKLTTMEKHHTNKKLGLLKQNDKTQEFIHYQSIQKSKSVADYFREQLPAVHGLQRSQSDDTELQKNKATYHKSTPNHFPKPIVQSVKEEKTEHPVSTMQTAAARGRRPAASSRSSFSMLVFATWSLLTWKTTITPMGLLGTTTNIMGMPASWPLPSFAWKSAFADQSVHVFPKANPFGSQDG